MKGPRLSLSRQSFLGTGSDTILDDARVAVIGLGGGGSHIVQQLAHVGVGHFELFDPDLLEETNINRLVGATIDDIQAATPKVVIGERIIRNVNPWARIGAHATDWRKGAEHLRACDVVFGCVDSFAARSELEVVCRRYLIPYIDIGMDVFAVGTQYSMSGQVVMSMPGRPCMRCMGFLRDDLIAKEAAQYGAAGGRPQVIWPNGVLASTAVGLFIELLTPWHDLSPRSAFLEYDGNAHSVVPSPVLGYVADESCHHFASLATLGDPFFSILSSEYVA
jgi:hypothetical protein